MTGSLKRAVAAFAFVLLGVSCAAADCKRQVTAQGEGISRPFAFISCRVNWRQEASRLFGAKYGSWDKAQSKNFDCRVTDRKIEGGFASACDCSALACSD
ncbi:MAG: hypothetical protein QOH67_44 [Hyphomicrobiales bacterium]|jgi:hypothetical protein|nr:hypothetical protein [Hyphomicrobiales bacterium]